MIQFAAQEVAGLVSGRVAGDPTVLVSNFAKIEEAQAGDLAFLANPKYESFVYTTEASVILVAEDFVPKEPIVSTLIHVSDPYAALALLMQLVAERMSHRPQGIDARAIIADHVELGEEVYIGPNACIETGARIGRGCRIYPGSYVGRGTQLGEDCIVYPNAVIYHDVVIGDRCILHAGCVIGADGFGFAPQLDGYHKIPQLGSVIIEDDVEVGANACIDRAVMGHTIIRKGVKLDNMVQIAHNCQVGEHTVMAAQAGLAGSSTVGSWCRFGGQVGVAGHLKIGDRVELGGQTGVLGNIKSDKVMLGSPAMEAGTALRSYTVIPKLPELSRKVSLLEKELNKITEQIHSEAR